MKSLGRVAFLCLNGIYQIRLYYKEKDIIEQHVRWPDGAIGKFAGFTRNGYLKYNQVESADNIQSKT